MLAQISLLSLSVLGGEDILCLYDGRIFENLSMEQTAEGVVVHFEHGDVVVPDDLVMDCILANPAPPIPANEEEREKYEKGYVRYEGKWISQARRDQLREKMLAERRALVEDIKHTSVWRNRIREKTKNFDFEATVPRPVFEGYRDQMEAYFQAFMKYWRIKPPKEPLKVCFYGDQEKYLQITGVPPYVQAFFRFVEPYELNVYYDRLNPRDTEEVMYHEANHYLQKLIEEGFKYPHWPGESLAEYYAGTTYDEEKGDLEFGHVLDGRLTEVKQDILEGERVSLKRMILEGPDSTYRDYTWGWSFVHFMLESKKYEKKFRKFYVALATAKDVRRSKGSFNLDWVEGEDMLEAFMKYMGLRSEEDLQELEQEWYTYIDEMEVVGPRGLEKAAHSAAQNDLGIKARRLFKEAIEGGTRNPVTFHRYAMLMHRDDDYDAAIAAWKDAMALDPLTARYAMYLGRAYMDRNDPGDVDEGIRLLQLAFEIDPEDSWLQGNLARMLREYEQRKADEAEAEQAAPADDDSE